MAAHNELGQFGEQLAEEFLSKNGYEIIDRNCRQSHFELDLVATKEGVLHFIEVKTRRTKSFGLPEEAVDEVKIGRLLNVGEEFLYQHPEWKHVQFDVLAINLLPQDEIEYFLIEDVYI